MAYDKLSLVCVAFMIAAPAAVSLESPAISQSYPAYVIGSADVAVRTIAFDDLNLASAQDGVRLSTRVRTAIDSVCDEATGGYGSDPDGNGNMARCVGQAWGQARPQMRAAMDRAREIAAAGSSSIAAAAAIVISIR